MYIVDYQTMAEAGSDSLPDRYQCDYPSTEKHLLKQPLMFPCKHHFCKGCVNINISDNECNNNYGDLVVACPVCKTNSNYEEIKDGEVMEKIINAYTKVSSGDRRCELCKCESSIYWCNGCKQEMCDKCKNIHSNVDVLKAHKIDLLGEIQQKVIVNSVCVCPEHKEEIKMNCTDCKRVMCFMCHMTNPCDEHNPKTIEKSIEMLEPKVREQLKTVVDDIEFIGRIIENLSMLECKTKEQEDNFMNEIEFKRIELNTMLFENAQEVKSKVKEICSAKLQEIDNERCRTQNYLTANESIKVWTDNYLDHLEGVELLLEIQGDLMTTLSEYKPYDKNKPLVNDLKTEIQYVEHKGNMLAILRDEGEMVPQLHEEIQMLEDKLQIVNKSNTGHVRQLQQSEGEIRRGEKEIADYVKNIYQLQNRIESMNEENIGYVKKIQQIQNKMDRLNEEITGYASKIQQLEPRMERLNKGNTEYISRIQKLTTENCAYVNRIHRLNTEKTEYVSRMKRMKEENIKYVSKIEMLRKENAEYVKKIQQLECKMKWMG